MLLPKPPTSTCLRLFWLLVALSAGVLTALLLAVVGQDAFALAGGAVVAVAIVIPGWVQPYAVAMPYRMWNWLAGRVADVLSRYVTRVCLLTVALSGRPSKGASAFVAESSAASMWVPRSTQAPAAYRSQSHDERVVAEGGGPSRLVAAWARHTGNRWAWSLLPFIALLRLLDAAPEKGRPAAAPDIYTLY